MSSLFNHFNSIVGRVDSLNTVMKVGRLASAFLKRHNVKSAVLYYAIFKWLNNVIVIVIVIVIVVVIVIVIVIIMSMHVLVCVSILRPYAK